MYIFRWDVELMLKARNPVVDVVLVVLPHLGVYLLQGFVAFFGQGQELRVRTHKRGLVKPELLEVYKDGRVVLRELVNRRPLALVDIFLEMLPDEESPHAHEM